MQPLYVCCAVHRGMLASQDWTVSQELRLGAHIFCVLIFVYICFIFPLFPTIFLFSFSLLDHLSSFTFVSLCFTVIYLCLLEYIDKQCPNPFGGTHETIWFVPQTEKKITISPLSSKLFQLITTKRGTTSLSTAHVFIFYHVNTNVWYKCMIIQV